MIYSSFRITANVCKGWTTETIDGKDCKIPFEYYGKTYNKCTEAWSEGKPWCFVVGGSWGYCKPCPGKYNYSLFYSWLSCNKT